MNDIKTEKKIFSRKCDIFISYRSDGGKEFAGRLHDRLEKEGYRVFLDVKKLKSGDYREQIFSCLDNVKDFLLVLSPKALDVKEDDDLFMEEISYALKNNKNIVPIEIGGFVWPEGENLPQIVKQVSKMESIPGDHRLFEQMIIALEKRDKISKKKFLKSKRHWDFKKRLLVLVSSSLILLGITMIIAFFYNKNMPVFSLDIANNSEFIDNSKVPDDSWDLHYTILSNGGSIANVNIEPIAILDMIVVSRIEGMDYRMGSVSIEFRNYFEDSYHIDDAESVSVSIPETQADKVVEYLDLINKTLHNKDFFVREYALKTYFKVTYKDMFGIIHHEILEPENNNYYIYVSEDIEDIEYIRYISNPMLVKSKSIMESYFTISLLDDITSDAEGIAKDIENDKKILKKSCYSKEDGMLVELEAYYKVRNRISDDMGFFIGYHAEHFGCTLKDEEID